jgi:hypothetical protein
MTATTAVMRHQAHVVFTWLLNGTNLSSRMSKVKEAHGR